MTAQSWLLLLVSAFAFIALRAFQQLNVVHDQKLLVMPTSALMAITEVSILLNAVSNGFWSWVPMWLGGGTGCLFAMWLHKRVKR